MKILLALNNPVYGAYVAEVLIRLGHEVRIVNDGIAALEALRSESWDELVIGVVIDNFNGLEVIEQAKEAGRLPEKVFVVTRIRNPKTRRSALKLGITDYLLLPIDTSLLIERIG